jgi:hypothetical protein
VLRRRILGRQTGKIACAAGAVLALLWIAVVQARVTEHQLARTPAFDEGQYLHAAWLLTQGQRIYRDFFDNHSPLLYASLGLLEPARVASDGGFDVRAFFTSARIAVGVCGTLAAACAALLAFRITRRVSAPVLVAAALTGSHWTWFAGMSEVRAEPTGLCLFWAGALALLWDRAEDWKGALRAGVGIGLVAFSAAWNPKWPLESLTLGAVYLHRVGKLARRSPPLVAVAIAPAVVLAGAAVSLVLSLASARDYFVFASQFNRFLANWFQGSAIMVPLFHGRPFYFCSRAFRGVWPLLGGGIVATSLASRRARGAWAGRGAGGVATVLVLAVAGGIEIVALYAFPNLWPQYYLMWSFSLAVVYGCVPGACAAIGRGHFALTLDAVAILTAIVLHHSATRARLSPLPIDFYWTSVASLVRSLRPGDTVWVEPHHHPIAAPDADYYWHGFNDTAPAAFVYAREHPESGMPPESDGDLPLCRLERGEEPRLRFVSGGIDIQALPREVACFARLREAGVLVPSRMPLVYEVAARR